MHQISLVPALLSGLFFPFQVYAADINLSLKEKTDYFTFYVNISGLEKSSCKDKTCYLQGMFTSVSGSPKYFGLTFGNNDWFPYIGSPEKDFIKTNFIPFETNSEGSWSGIVRLSVDKSDSDYKGPGQYLVKIRRYTGESTSPATDDINQLTVDINEPTPSPSQTPSPTTNNTPTSTVTLPSSPASTKTPTPNPTTSKSPTSVPTVNNPTSIPSFPLATPSVIPSSSQRFSAELSAEKTFGNSSPAIESNVLGDSTDLGSTSHSAEINLNTNIASPSIDMSSEVISETKPTSYKYIVIFGAMVSLISSGLLYFRYRRAKIYQ